MGGISRGILVTRVGKLNGRDFAVRVGLVYDELLPTIREQLWEGKK